MSTLELFTYAETEVRVVAINGEPWFVLADLAKVLDIAAPARLASRLDEGVRLTHTLDTSGGPQRMTIVSEAGMYEVVIRSDKPEAAAFRRWITTEVLPAIRKHGGYLTPEATEAALTDPDFIIGLANQLKQERARREAAELESQARRAQLAVVEPKADAFDLWLSSNVHYSVDTAAKALSAAGVSSMGRNRLFLKLAELGWAYRTPDGWRPYQQHGPEGTKRLAVKVARWQNDRTGEQGASTTLRVTAKGIADLAKHFGVMADVVAENLEDAA